MISAGEVRIITQKFKINEEETKKFCDETISLLIKDRANKGKYFLKFDIINVYEKYFRLSIKNCNKKVDDYYDVPSVDIMWDILVDAGYTVDITTYDNGNSTWIVWWNLQ